MIKITKHNHQKYMPQSFKIHATFMNDDASLCGPQHVRGNAALGANKKNNSQPASQPASQSASQPRASSKSLNPSHWAAQSHHIMFYTLFTVVVSSIITLSMAMSTPPRGTKRGLQDEDTSWCYGCMHAVDHDHSFHCCTEVALHSLTSPHTPTATLPLALTSHPPPSHPPAQPSTHRAHTHIFIHPVIYLSTRPPNLPPIHPPIHTPIHPPFAHPSAHSPTSLTLLAPFSDLPHSISNLRFQVLLFELFVFKFSF